MDCLSLFFVFLFFCSVTLKLGKVRYTYNISMSITVHLETCYEHLFWLGWVFLFCEYMYMVIILCNYIIHR